MAPITRSSVHGRSTTAQAGRSTGEDMDMEPEDAFDEQVSDDDTQQSLREESHDSGPFRSAQDMLLPLQETANRVSRQVEEFAKSLDKFNAARDVDNQNLWEDAWELLDTYSRLAKERREATVTKNQQNKPLAKNRPSLGGTEQQLANLKLEESLWKLTEHLLVCKSPRSIEEAKENRETRLTELHRYSTNVEVWNAFLDSDIVAQEYECVLDWLQETAAQNGPSLEDVVSEITARSDRGDGIWSAGLIYTKDAIKKQKRSRAWPMPLDPSNPGLFGTHIRSDDDEPLVTQMDPDAPLREKASLTIADENHEEAAWQICWEMLRRGLHLEETRRWWSDRKELWRSTVVRNSSNQKDQKWNSPWLRIINIGANPEWFDRLQNISKQDVSVTNFEQAVYGVLCGDHFRSRMGGRRLDDQLFSFFNSLLIERYRRYLAAYKQKLGDSGSTTFEMNHSAFPEVQRMLQQLQTQGSTKDELHESHKYLEAAIIGQNFEEFFVQAGQAAAQVAHLLGQSAHLIEKDTSETENDCARITAQDQDSVRMVAHLQLVLRSLGLLDRAYESNPYQMENNIVNYIGFLERDSKFTLLPLYASTLSDDRTTMVLGTILVKVTDTKERDILIKLMRQYKINVPMVLYAIFQLANYEAIENLKSIKDARSATKITHTIETGSIKTTKIVQGFMSDNLSSDEEKAVQSAEWMCYMDVQNWGMAAWSVSTLYKILLLTGKLQAAKVLATNVQLTKTSMSAVGMNLNLGAIVDENSENGDIDMDGSSTEGRVQPVSPTKRKTQQKERSVHPLAKESTNRDELAAQSLVWAQLEQLVVALDCLERWQDIADEVESVRGNMTQMRVMKRGLQDALNELQNAMSVLFDPEFLTKSNDDSETQALTLIRNHYIPECILGYNSALYFAGHSLTRQYLVHCMDLAQEVAQNEMLTNAFMDSGRMRELVNAFALDSQALLRANEAGGHSKSRKGKRESIGSEGKGDIWQVSWREETDLDLDGME